MFPSECKLHLVKLKKKCIQFFIIQGEFWPFLPDFLLSQAHTFERFLDFHPTSGSNYLLGVVGSCGQHHTDTLQVLDRKHSLAWSHSHPNLSTALVREMVLRDNRSGNMQFMLSVTYSKIYLWIKQTSETMCTDHLIKYLQN